jgi:hypothetical protein
MEKRNKIPNSTALFMIVVALIYDAIGAILDFLLIGIVLNPIFVTPFGWLHFYVWFKRREVNFMDSTKRAITMFLMGLFEEIPILNALPGWTVGVIILIIIVRSEDGAYNKKLKENHPQPTQRQIPSRLYNREEGNYEIHEPLNDNMPIEQLAA